ncbi:MAG: leucine--tRNA ligase [Flavobacterium sp.]|nr:leucine--tRNA ligase [Pedobacter sp.]
MDYQFRDIEKKWQQFWAENETYKVSNNSPKPKYYVLDMFPYPSGAGLHVGHPLGYIASDIFARYKRLKGFNVLHPMGYDSFGLPAEQYAIQTGQHPAITTETNINRYRQQLDNIGFSYDWSREVRTSDPAYYKWTQWIFMKLFNSWYNLITDIAEPIQNLIKTFETSGNIGVQAVADEDVYQFSANHWLQMSETERQRILLKYRLTYLRESTVNWCPALGTVLANDEVKDGFSERGGYPVEQKKMMQWSMRITAYAERLLQGLSTIDWPEPLKEMQRNWIGKSVGAMVDFSLSLTPVLSKEEGTKGEGFEKLGYQTADPAIWEILKQNSKANRQNQTEAESELWQYLQGSKIGYKISRQHAVGTYIADFICLSKGLVIEVDGGYYDTNSENDKLRTNALNQLGFEVIRFQNDEVITNPNAVAQQIKQMLNNLPDRKVLSFEEDLGEANSFSFGEGRAEAITVFTTRVDTIYGATFLVLAPEHELVEKLTTPDQKKEIENYIAQTKKKSELDRMADTKSVSGAFTGSYAFHPLSEKEIPIWIADYVLAGYGTGAVMAVPSGDQRDWLFAKKYNLAITAISDAQKDLNQQADPTKEGRYINSDLINGMTYAEASKALIKKLEETGAGKAKINFRLRDAVFGRQRYWGEPVPLYFKDGLPYLIKESEIPLILPEVDKYLPTESGEPPLARAENWRYAPVQKVLSFGEDLREATSLSEGENRVEAQAFDYELSTMPGWAGSSWYWYRYMASTEDRNENVFAPNKAIEYWKDVDLYIGGSEHATGHLLYSRFWNKFLKDLGYVGEEEPFKKLINQGMIQGRSNFVYRLIDNDGLSTNTFISHGHISKYKTTALHVDVNIVHNEILDIEAFKNSRAEFNDAIFIFEDAKILNSLSKGESRGETYICGHEVEKMSKSKFNVVSPDDIIEKYGADTLRMYEMFLGPLEQSKPWNTNGIEGVFKFLRKFWKLYHDDDFNFRVSDDEPTKAEYKALHKIIRKVEEDVERFSFNTSVSSFMICVNELTDLKCHKKKILQQLVIVLHPYAPHITEELWTLLGNKDGTLSFAEYPKFISEYLVENEFAYPISVNGKTRMNLNISLSLTQAEVENIVLNNEHIQTYLDGKNPRKIIFVKGKIVNLVV